jgi:hypothetical protein
MTALLLCLAASFSTLAASTNENSIWRPRFATPAIVALDSSADRQFTAEVKCPATATNWAATIANDLKTWPCKIVSANYSTINPGAEPGWQVRVSVPANASPELFRLNLSSSEGSLTQPQAVSIIPAFSTNFYILHLSDEQIVNKIHTDPSGQFHKTVGTWEELMWMQEPVNLINPRFVIVTGDQIDFNGALDGWNNWSNWGYQPGGKRPFTPEETLQLETRLADLYQDAHQGYRVPYVETPGNHDVPPIGKKLLGSTNEWHAIAAGFYETHFGQRSWSFRMQDFYVLLHDWSDPTLRDWAANDYDAARQDQGIHYRLIGQHYHAGWDGAPKGAFPFTPRTADLMLIGHGHKVATMQSSPYYIYMDGPTFSYGTAGFFNFRRATTGWTCDQTSVPRNFTNDVWPLFTRNGETKKVRSDQPDPMNVTANAITIINDLPQTFYDGRVRFVLPKGRYQSAQNATVLASYDCDQGNRTAVLVKVPIPAHGSIKVSLIPNETRPVDSKARSANRSS